MKNHKVSFIASVKEDSINDIDVIAKNLTDMGCHIDRVLKFSGVITGNTSASVSLDNLKIEGVKKVEVDRKVKAISH